MSSSCLIHLTLHRLHSLLAHVSDCSPDELCLHTMLQRYTFRASSALSQVRPALAFFAKSLIPYSYLQRNPFFQLVFRDPHQQEMVWWIIAVVQWCQIVSNFEIAVPKKASAGQVPPSIPHNVSFSYHDLSRGITYRNCS